MGQSQPRYERLMDELEDLDDLRREKAKDEKGVHFTEVLREYEYLYRAHLGR